MKLPQPIQALQELISPTCSRTAFLLSRQSDERLPRLTAFFMRTHLLLCQQCRSYSRNLSFLARACSSYDTHIADLSAQHLSEEARHRLQSQIQSLLGSERSGDG